MNIITRRLFLRSVPPAVAVGTVIATPFIAEAIEREPQKTLHELAIWHMRELERLVHKDGAARAVLIAIGFDYDDGKARALHLLESGQFLDKDGMFRIEGGQP